MYMDYILKDVETRDHLYLVEDLLVGSVSSKNLVIAHGVYYIHPRSRTIDRHDVSHLAWPESRAPTGCAAPHSMFRQPVCVLSPDPKGHLRGRGRLRVSLYLVFRVPQVAACDDDVYWH